jgi:drug/metabolite transporter (DMT)-like permease
MNAIISEWKILLALFGLVAARTVDQVLYYRLSYMYSSYVWFLGAIMIPVGYLFVLWPIVWYKMYVSKEIDDEHRQFSQKAMFIMATFDTLSNVIGTFAVPYLSGSVINVLNNSVLPITMALAIVILRTKFKMTHYIGAVLVIVGILVRLTPQFQNSGNSEKDSGLWIVVYIASLIPMGLSNVYKEGGLKKMKSDVWYVNAWIGVWQLLQGFATIPTVFIPWPAPAEVIEPNTFGTYIQNACTCFFTGTNPKPSSGDDCESVWLVFVLYLAFNIAFNQLMLIVFKKGSSVLAVISSTVRLPLVDLLLLWRFLAGPATIAAFTQWDAYALVLIIVGIVAYKLKEEESRENKKVIVDATDILDHPESVVVPEEQTRRSWTPKFLSRRFMSGSSPSLPKRF